MGESNKKYNETKISSAILKFPKEDQILLDAIEMCKKLKEDIMNGKLSWGLGPQTVKYIVEKYKLQEYVKPWYFANSCSCHHVDSIINPNFISKECDKNVLVKYATNIESLHQDTYFVHLWNEFWRRNNIDKDKEFPKECLYEQFKSKYLVKI